MDIVVKKSTIHGIGVFAKRGFKKGETVTKWAFREITKAQAGKLTVGQKKFLGYYKGKYFIMKAPAKYMNHSCRANTRIRDFCDVARRNIRKGEEITANYAENFAPGDFLKCKCGQKNCRKLIKPKVVHKKAR